MRNSVIRLLGLAVATVGLCPCALPAQQFPSWPSPTRPFAAGLAPSTSMPNVPPGFLFMPVDSAPSAPRSAAMPLSPNSVLQPPALASQEKIPPPAKEPETSRDPPVIVEDVGGVYVNDGPDEPYIQQMVFWEGTRGPALYARASYLLWWVDKAEAPPLVVVGPLAAPTSVIGGGDLAFEDRQRHGGRFVVGSWLDFRQTLAAEAEYFFLASRRQSVTVSSTGIPLISRVFTDVNTGGPGSITLATPGGVPLPPGQTGSSTVDAFSRLWGAAGTAKRELHRAGWGFVDLLAGVRFVQLDEGLTITDITQFGGAPATESNALITIRDEFGTHNQFFGGELGLASEVRIGQVFMDFFGKTALGNNRQTVVINGATAIRGPPPPLLGTQDLTGGVLALPTNIGRYRRDQFAIIPQAGVNIGFQFNDYVRASIGYSFLYISNVVRPGDQIDTGVNPTRIPRNIATGAVPAGPLRPAFGFRDTDYWAQGLNFGLELRY